MSAKWEAVIGLEVHAQMLTETKIFCGCSTKFGSAPNSQTCPVCIGMPGVLPVLNEKALDFAINTGIVTGCAISPFSRFARKNYFYPDLPKAYQISQYELPICEHGHLDITVDGRVRRIGITRIHMEEDAGKNIHEARSGFSLVDLNRTGTPLMEIVSEPDLRTPEEASAYMKKLRELLSWIGVCDGNMEQGSLRCDANISIRPMGEQNLGTKVELKNINSFRFVERAIAYEIKRQIKAKEDGTPIVQETRLFDTEAGITVSMRSKEEAHDYRYFPDPDLVPITDALVRAEHLRPLIPELPDARKARFVEKLGLSEEDAELICEERLLADWFEAAVQNGGQPKTVANWIMGSIMKHLNEDNITIENYPIPPEWVVELIKLVENNTISNNSAKKVLDEAYSRAKQGGVTGFMDASFPGIVGEASGIVNELGLSQISDEGAIEQAVLDVINANPAEVERMKAGDQKLMGFFVGQIMKATKGKANPKLVNDLIRRHAGL